MEISSPYQILNSPASAAQQSQNRKSLGLDFSNMTPQEMESARRELSLEGKISLHQSVTMALMDGYALEGVNGGKLVSGSTNMYAMIDSLLDYQEKNGVFNVQQNIESLKSLRKVLEENDVNYTTSTTSITA
ncbi:MULTISPECIES: hypothetical protein [Acetobacter]|jgi:hypothetical protein|uniref:Uncharacterized protein n=2 Tax=Acetobacter TaxID=434 RepID=A0A841QDL0_9PROT|nr:MULTISPECIES: hypothetical protein [Acetobacter]MBB6456207.1 hypothetical protein [Acetobacter lovaniensis]MCI1697911.1 hypothetical protein [Acetobacter lovaniensis]MCP1239041.1 hypothetical protein [Acetobacter lovaniensis]OUJ00500.1 hypothetical protein HK20_12675 [Acetobacter sp. DsW_54]PAK78986.1 hypothetical protein B8X00_03670 [Acetobacter fabarum]